MREPPSPVARTAENARLPYATGAVPLTTLLAQAHPALVASDAPLPESVSYLAHDTPIANQGPRGTCVAFAVKKQVEVWMSILSGMNPKGITPVSALDLYNQGRQRAGWGADTPDGLYVAPVMNVLRQPLGIASETSCPYVWDQVGLPPSAVWRTPEWNIDQFVVGFGVTALKTALQHGPAVIVVTCDSNLFFPPRNGFVHTGTYIPEAHALCVLGYSEVTSAFLVANSWGTSYGLSGYVWLGYDFVEARGNDITSFQPNVSLKLDGDVTFDGKITPGDVTRALSDCVGTGVVTDLVRRVLDLNHDSRINVLDAQIVLRKLVGLA